MNTPQFGAMPEDAELARISASPYYAGGTFRNLIPEKAAHRPSFGAFFRFLFGNKANCVPPVPLPSRKINLNDGKTNRLIWFGHSSFLLQLGGRNFLIDPVFSQRASPVPFIAQAFPGTDIYSCEDMPYIDWLIISHDHWDHLDYPTILKLKPVIGQIVCPLGVDAHFRRWNFPENAINPMDWGQSLNAGNNTLIHCVSSRHFSGRTLTRNKSLWAGYIFEAPESRLYFSGDGGYGPHFAEVGKKFGTLDIALLDCGQYDKCWPHVHMTPEQAAQAAEDSGVRAFLPVHAGKFVLALHAWDDPFRRAVSASYDKRYHLLTPLPGEPIDLTVPFQTFSHWWENIDSKEKIKIQS